MFTDGEGGSIHLLDSPIQDLRTRLTRSWQQMVGRKWEHRKGFQGLRFVSTELSRPDPKLPPEELSFIRIAQNGSFYTHDALTHAGLVENACCKFCAQPDSVFHRHWECPHTEQSRRQIPPTVMEHILQAPQCLQEHGWAVEPDEVRQYRDSLDQIPDQLTAYLPVARQQSHWDLFCDGSGLDPKYPSIRLVAWAVVVAGSHPQQSHTPLTWGGVPGQHQTVLRAELFAFTSSLMFGVRKWQQCGSTFAIWSDCETIIKRARAIQLGMLVITSAMTDHDLWMIVQATLPAEPVCQLHHIKSHQMYHDAEAWIQWACSANDMADKVAEFALQTLPPVVLQGQAAAKQAYLAIKQAIRHVHLHIVRVARLSVDHGEAPQSAPPKPADQQPIIQWHQIAIAAADRAPQKLRFVGFHKVLEWFQTIQDSTASPKWYSWYELLFAFQMMTGEWGIQSTSKNNTWQLYAKTQEYDMRQTCRSWASFLIQMIRLVFPDFKAEDSRPSNGRFRCWAMGVKSQLSGEVDSMLHEWFQQQLNNQPIQKITSLLTLPVADISAPPEPVNLSHGLHRFWHRG